MRYLMILAIVLSMFSFACYDNTEDADNADWVLRYEVSSTVPVTVTFAAAQNDVQQSFVLDNDSWYAEMPIDEPMIYHLKVVSSSDTTVFAAVYIKESDNKSMFVLGGGEQILKASNSHTFECSGGTPWY